MRIEHQVGAALRQKRQSKKDRAKKTEQKRQTALKTSVFSAQLHKKQAPKRTAYTKAAALDRCNSGATVAPSKHSLIRANRLRCNISRRCNRCNAICATPPLIPTPSLSVFLNLC
jgi:hypothetical protein